MTPATRALDAAGVDYELTRYEAPSAGSFGANVVAELGLDPAAVGKTLVVALDDDRFALAVVPVAAQLDLRALAALAGAKRAAMAEPPDAERVTGYVRGGIAPLGTRRELPVFVDDALSARERVHVSGGRRGLELTLAAADLVAVTAAEVGPIAT